MLAFQVDPSSFQKIREIILFLPSAAAAAKLQLFWRESGVFFGLVRYCDLRIQEKLAIEKNVKFPIRNNTLSAVTRSSGVVKKASKMKRVLAVVLRRSEKILKNEKGTCSTTAPENVPAGIF